MNAPRFWWRQRQGAAAAFLTPMAGLYGGYAGRRMRRRPDYWPALPVVCVGSFTVGGDGKTPTAMAICRLMQELELNAGFLTRGYRGAEKGPNLVDLARHDPRRTGDEPRLLASMAPTVISADRPRGARLLAELGVDAIIMDDGLQNPHLGKDLTLVVVDAAMGVGNGLTIPAGPLRAPLSLQIALADAIILAGAGPAAEVANAAARSGRPVLRAQLVADDADRWKRMRVYAFAGIGRPGKFFDSLSRTGAVIVGSRSLADHHFYSEAEARDLLRRAEAGNARLVTTAKDHVRLAGADGARAELRRRSEVFGVHMEFGDQEIIRQLVRTAVRRAQARS